MNDKIKSLAEEPSNRIDTHTQLHTEVATNKTSLNNSTQNILIFAIIVVAGVVPILY